MSTKLPRPPGDYLVGKYANGSCYYLILKTAWDTWYVHKGSVRHYCIKNNDGLPLMDYPLKGDVKYEAYALTKVPEDWKAAIKADCPDIYNQLWPVKSEPTPDEYYILPGLVVNHYFVLRTELEKCLNADLDSVRAKPWAKLGQYSEAINANIENKNGGFKHKEFPQLSSDVKRELQKLNPERYKEWEDFYVQKYPGFKRLDEVIKYPFDISDLSKLELYCMGTGCYVFIRDSRDIKKVWKSKSRNILVSSPFDHLQDNWGSYINLKDYAKDYLKEYQPELFNLFEQYYKQQEAKSKIEHYNMTDKTADMFYLYTVGHGWELARREAIDGLLAPPRATSKVMLIKVSDYSIREVEYQYITQWKPLEFNQLSRGRQDNFRKQNPILFEQWSKQQPIGKAAGAYSAFEQRKRSTRGSNGIGNSLSAGDRYYASVDPYQVDFETSGVVTIYSKEDGAYKSIRRECVEETQKLLFDYFNQQNNSHLKQQNNEQIILCRPVKPVIRHQVIGGNPAQSNRVKPTVANGHLSHEPRAVSGKKNPGKR